MIDHDKLARALRDVDESTKGATDDELVRAWNAGLIPTGVLSWIRVCRTPLFKNKVSE